MKMKKDNISCDNVHFYTCKEYKEWIKGKKLTVVSIETFLGPMLVGKVEQVLVYAAFYKDEEEAKSNLKQWWSFWKGDEKLVGYEEGRNENLHFKDARVGGTIFQIHVWKSLYAVSYGEVVSYKGLGEKAGLIKKFRAIGNAVSKNCLAWIIPCHRVCCANGQIGGFRWGQKIKQALLEWEKKSQRGRVS